MTENFEQQSYLVHTMVQNKFEGILDKGTKDEDIMEKTKNYVKSKLQHNLEELSDKHTYLAGQFEKHKQITTIKVNDLETQTNEQSKKLSAREQEVERLKSELKIKSVSESLNKWQRVAYWILPVAFLIIIFTVFQFCFKEWEFNFSYKIINAIDNLNSDTQKNTLRTLMYAPLIGLWLIGNFVWHRLGPSEKREQKIFELNKNFDEKHKD